MEDKLLINNLIGTKYKVNGVQAIECSLANKNGTVVIFYIENTNLRIAYSITDGIEKVSAGDFISKEKVEVYDVIDDKIYNTTMVEVIGDKVNTTFKLTPYNDKEKTLVEQKNEVGIKSAHSNCVTVCDLISSAGCTGFGLWKCAIICGGLNIPCDLICGAIWWA